jgi:RNA polymerase sigma-70 factor, ECF subfamily
MPAPDPPDELIAACRAGAPEAFAQLFELYRDRVYAIAYGICGEAGTAADISQDVFMKLLTRMEQFEGRASFTAWLFRIVVNTATDHHRRAQRVLPLSADLAGRWRVDDDYARAQLAERVERAVQALPLKLRTPLVLRHVEGLSYAEIARVLRLSMGTVASRLSRAHARLARELAGAV